MAFHSEEWYTFVTSAVARPEIRSVNPVILNSWQRSYAAGVKPDSSQVLLTRVQPGDLVRRLQHNAHLIGCAKPLLDEFSLTQTHISHVLYLVDHDGIVLHSTGNNQLMRAYGLLPGYDWSEARMGTNGAGTAIASGRPVAVVGPDHYQLPFHDSTCLAAPIKSPGGQVIGAIDFSSAVGDDSPDQLQAVIQLAQSIESQLKTNTATSD